MKRFASLVCATLLVSSGLWAQAVAPSTGGNEAAGTGSAPASAGTTTQGSGGSEDEFFGSGQVEAPQGSAETKNPGEAVEKERLGLSGELQALSSYTMSRKFVDGSAGFSDNSFANTITGDFFVDARLPKSFRMFMDLNIDYVPTGVPVPITFTVLPQGSGTLNVLQNQNTLLDIKEVFVDFNFANTVKFRAGKQVLQWGTGYFWNPTDLINVAHKSFTNLGAPLNGVFGLRSDVIFSPDFHLYTFLNLDGVQDITNVAYAARTEFLVGQVEFGFVGWYEYSKIPVFGADLTMPLFWKLNMTGEAAFSYGDNQQKIDTSGNSYSVSNQLVSKVDVGLSRNFDLLDVQDRVTVMTEFFWNSDGYSQNMFQTLTDGNLYLFASTYYHAGYYGQYYGAAFISINDFGSPNMTLSLDALCNFSDMSAIALVGLSYEPVSNFTLQAQVGSFLGANNSEYTVSVNPTTNTITNNQFFTILSATVNF